MRKNGGASALRRHAAGDNQRIQTPEVSGCGRTAKAPMVLGSGIDVIAVDDVQRELAHGTWTAADGILRDSELHFCNAVRTPARRLAACFAAKEAVLKALGMFVADLEMFREVEVNEIERGHMTITLHDRVQNQSAALGVRRILVALHTDRRLAAAMVILEG